MFLQPLPARTQKKRLPECRGKLTLRANDDGVGLREAGLFNDNESKNIASRRESAIFRRESSVLKYEAVTLMRLQ